MEIDSGWKMKYEGLEAGTDQWPRIMRSEEDWLPCTIPCDVHVPLIDNGIIEDPLDKLNCFDSEWIEEKSWWFKTSFDAPQDFRDAELCELSFEMLDVEADVFLNGVHLGHHKSAFYPFVRDVKKLLRVTDNLVGVRVTSGIERISDADLAGFKGSVSTEAKAGRGTRGDVRRALLRKPQYVFGWDWGPRVATVGIMGAVRLEMCRKLLWRNVRVLTRSATRERAVVRVRGEVENTHLFSTRESVISFTLSQNGSEVAAFKQTVALRSGVNYFETEFEIEDPALWWPNGYGDQPLYEVFAHAEADGETADTMRIKAGIRTITLDQTAEHGGRRFAFVVNGVRIFAKGGDWIPADSIYARVLPDKYRRLLEEAKTANFNMVRIWGGGRYEADEFYDECDRLGILVWHDFMFACAVYPDNQEWYVEEVKKEAVYQTRRLRNHACIALFCGNNENNWFFDERWNDKTEPSPAFSGGATIYNRILPQVVQSECPDIPYWNGSPYGGEHPNGNDAGDRHHWRECTMSPIMENRIRPEAYDEVEARFVSEYGYIGPPVRSTVERYHAGATLDRTGAIWQHHNNTFEKQTVPEGIRKHYRDPEGIDLDDYLLFASLVQGLMYSYSLAALRLKEKNSGAIFWMYDDCWGEVGWTIIDYYGVRKPSYYFVKRAFAERSLVLREKDQHVLVYAMNDSAEDVAASLEVGVVDLQGTITEKTRIDVKIPGRFRGEIAHYPKEQTDKKRQLWYARLDGGRGFYHATLREAETRRLLLRDPVLSVKSVEVGGDGLWITVDTTYFAHAVHFALPSEVRLSDEYFDLLPGEERRVFASGAAHLDPKTITVRSVVVDRVVTASYRD